MMNYLEKAHPKDFNITRVSETKVRFTYKLPIYYENEKYLIGYKKMSLTLKSSCYITQERFTPFKSFDKYYNQLSNFYGIKKKCISMCDFIHIEEFEGKITHFNIPKYIYFQGEGVKEAVRKWKIQNIINLTKNS